MKKSRFWIIVTVASLVGAGLAFAAPNGPDAQRLAPYTKISDASAHQAFDAGTPAAAATTTATMPAASGQWNYLNAAVFTCAGGTAPAAATITGLAGGTINLEVPTATAGASLVLSGLNISSSAENTAITATLTAGASSSCRIQLFGSVE